MAKLPTAEELGQVKVADTRAAEPDFRATRDAAARITHIASTSGQGAEALGRGIAQLGHGISAGLEARQAADDKLNGALATASFSSSILNLNDEVSKTTDTAKLRDEFPAKYNAAMETAASYLPEQQKKLFMAMHGDDLTRGLLHVGTQVNKLEGDQQQADAYENVIHLRNANLKTDDPNAHAKAIHDMGTIYDALAEKGYITREVAAQRKDIWARDFAVAWVGGKPPAERLAILRATLGEAVGQEQDTTGKQPPGGSARARQGDFSAYQNAIKAIESHGSGGYNALGPRTASGDRAYGAYQVMGANIPPWTREALGYSLTPEQFRANPEAQDAVFNHQFGKYIQQYGTPQDAASVWFTGRPVSAAAGAAHDITGTTGNQYVSLFNRHLADQGVDGGSAHVDTRLSSLIPPDDLMKMVHRAESELSRQTHEQTIAANNEKATVNRLMADDNSSIMATGQEVPQLTSGRVEASLGPNGRVEFEQNRINAHDYYAQMNGIEQVSAGEMQARVASLAPQDGQIGFKERAKMQKTAQKIIDTLIEDRFDDPAASANKLPFVKASAREASLDRPWSYTPLVRARMAAQEQLGIPEELRIPITKAEANQLLGIIQQAPPQDKLKAIQSVVETVNGAYAEHATKALGFMLRAYHGNEELRAQAGIMLQKIASGQPLGLDDARQFDDVSTRAAADAVTEKTQGTFPLPHNEDMEMLRSDPAKYSPYFDDVFGPGTAATALGIGR